MSNNFTRIDNNFLDFIMNTLSPTAITVYLAIARKTTGFQKDYDRISYTQLKELTGLCVNAIKNAIKELIERQIVAQKKTNKGFVYKLIVSQNDTLEEQKTMSYNDISPNDISPNDTKEYHQMIQGVSPNDTILYHQMTPQKKKETIKRKKKDIVSVKSENPKKRFVKPSVEEIKNYCIERNNNIDSQQFFDYYESKGWVVGKSAMKDWKASVRTWERNNFNNSKTKNTFVEQGSNSYWEQEDLRGLLI